MSANYLVNILSFDWPDLQVDRSYCLDNLAEIAELMRLHAYRIWGHPDIYETALYEIISTGDFNSIRQQIQWIKKDHFKTLQRLLFSSPSGKPSRHFNDLEEEFPGDLNGLVGCIVVNALDHCVYDKLSFNELRITYYRNSPNSYSWNKLKHPFLPNLDYSNYHLAVYEVGEAKAFNLDQSQIDEIAKKFCIHTMRGYPPGGDREARAEEIGREVARRNFYTYCTELTARERHLRKGSLRSIFKLEIKGVSNYVSIDFEKATFEWCDRHGKHQGEYMFNGMQNSNKDDSGEHDIWALSRS